jgi:hypothetical protein
MSDLEPLKTGAVTWTVTVDGKGRFYADAPGFNQLTAKSYSELGDVCKVRASQARAKVAVPYNHFAWNDNGEQVMERGIATGLHAGNGKVLLRTDDGKTYQAQGYVNDYFTPMVRADADRMLAILREVQVLEDERRAILSRYKFEDGSLKQAVSQAVADAARNAAEYMRGIRAQDGED